MLRTIALVPFTLIALLLGFAWGGGLAGSSTQEPRPGMHPGDPPFENVHQRAIFHAVLEGLYLDGAENDVVDAILACDPELTWPRHFIYACPICMQAFNAFRAYRARPVFFGDKLSRDAFGWGLSKATRANLLSGDDAVVQIELEALVKRWLDAYVQRLRLDETEAAEWKARLEEMRKKGLAQLQDYKTAGIELYSHMDSCPWCDGAAGAMGGAPERNPEGNPEGSTGGNTEGD